MFAFVDILEASHVGSVSVALYATDRTGTAGAVLDHWAIYTRSRAGRMYPGRKKAALGRGERKHQSTPSTTSLGLPWHSSLVCVAAHSECMRYSRIPPTSCTSRAQPRPPTSALASDISQRQLTLCTSPLRKVAHDVLPSLPSCTC